MLALIAGARRQPDDVRGRVRLGIQRNLVVILTALTLILAILGWSGLSGLAAGRRSLERLYQHNLTDQQAVYQLSGHLDDAEELILRGWVSADRATRALLAAQLVSRTLPRVEIGIAEVTRAAADDAAQTKIAQHLAAQWTRFKALWGDGEWGSGASAGRSHHAMAVVGALDTLNNDANALSKVEMQEAAAGHRRALAAELSSRRAMIAALIAAVMVSLAIVVWLRRSLLRRILRFSRFASDVADGDYRDRLHARGRDELDQLGRVLDEVADSHVRAKQYDRSQLEFADALQLAHDELEAQHLLHRHLERTIPSSVVTVFNRNNSGDQLEPVAPIPPPAHLGDALEGASPHDCLSIRAATAHDENPEDEPLVRCELCRGGARRSTCLPLVVGGEVIGSVQVQHQTPLDADELRRVSESVRQAAPVIANLRNLAIAQRRASIDELTGLPNRRALDDTLRRMVAQANRSGLPLSALMLDLDHFKAVNDQFGHAKGDDALAAVGAALTHILRSSDFAARYGGEEFLILLADTDIHGGIIAAEKTRRAVSRINLPGEPIRLTASIGLAALPDHATDAEEIQRAADRALYAAKIHGRNRVEIASAAPETSADQPFEPATT